MLKHIYDETALKERLSRLDRKAKTAFAAACAESLAPLQERYFSRTGDSGPAARAREILDAVWAGASSGHADVSSLEAEAAELGPTDDEEWSFDMGYAQNGAAALAYAIRTWLSDDAQEAAWAARQVHEAAEYSFSQPNTAPGNVFVRKVSEASSQAAGSDSSAGMQSVLAFLDQALGICEDMPSTLNRLQSVARSAGQSWASLFRQ